MNTSIIRQLFRRSLDTRESSGATQWGMMLLRGGSGVMIFYIHGWHKLLGGIAYLQDGAPWKLAEEVAEMHTPAPLLAAFAATLVQLICSLLLAAGICTRINALLLTGALGGAVLQNLMANRDPQLAMLYTLVALTFVIAGGGRFSLDATLFKSELHG